MNQENRYRWYPIIGLFGIPLGLIVGFIALMGAIAALWITGRALVRAFV